MTHILGVQFIEDGKNIALISSSWLIPRKTEAYWPPYKSQYKYEQSLKKGEIPTNEWSLYKIDILFNSKSKNKIISIVKYWTYIKYLHYVLFMFLCYIYVFYR